MTSVLLSSVIQLTDLVNTFLKMVNTLLVVLFIAVLLLFKKFFYGVSLYLLLVS